MTGPSRLSSQDYLAAIYEMAEESIPTVQAELARWMGVSAASVSEAVKRLRQRGLVAGMGRELRFTEAGRAEALRIVRRHRLSERFLIEVLGLPWHQAHQEAGSWEHAISDQVEDRIADMLGDPPTCPHGNPIPGSSRTVDHSDLRPLQGFAAGDRVTLERLTEDLELDLDVMRYFEERGLMPGATIVVDSVAPDGTMTLEVNGVRAGLGSELTDNLWVRAEQSEPATTGG
jgi:DtxR family transcriptional regulator, Mn-dependent transcriptional regulator